MSSDKTPENSKKQDLTRSKQSRRKMLKSMAAGSGAVIAGKSVPDQWAKPMVDSVLLPVHAQTSGPTSCTVGGDIQVVFDSSTDAFADQTDDGAINPPFALPGDYTVNTISSDSAISFIPQINVTPGVTDNFTLNSIVSADVANVSDLTQASVAPDPVNGAIPFNTIEVDAAFFNITMTLTPDNSAFCGGPQVIDILFND
ncbi:MAG: hypothetical protein KAJ95_05990 [Gammaproteobacteria bacterium]|nr:hypothetical protein [Gammaproteobacteria bacterium]